MALPTVKDLPDPLDSTPTSASANPDDLLAQMADEAINKLMAEAEKDDLPVRTPPRAPVQAVTEPVAEVSAPPEPPPAAPSIESTLDAAVAQAKQASEPIDLPHDESPHNESALTSPPSPQPAEVSEDSIALLGTTDDVVLPIEEHAVPSSAADVKALLAEPVHHDHAGASVVLLPLRIVNAPFAVLGDRVRNAVGQIAIVTLINALAVLAYVLIFRRHH
ncbi:MAG: hypothetical protein ACTHLZ_16290 [Tepidisphaeraceae bacterium]